MNQKLETSTRKVILTMLKTQGELSVGDISKQLGITEMAVRRHLNTLERDGLLEARLVRQAMGRPTHHYVLTDRAEEFFPKNYHHLTLDLLGELLKEEGQERIDVLFQKREDNLIHKYESRMLDKSLEERVSELASIQNENGYMVNWERYGEGEFVLSEHNCPISQVANRYQQACQCELSLFQRLMDADVERTECLAKGGLKCSYIIKSKLPKLKS